LQLEIPKDFLYLYDQPLLFSKNRSLGENAVEAIHLKGLVRAVDKSQDPENLFPHPALAPNLADTPDFSELASQ
jgi:hypothetical protein